MGSNLKARGPPEQWLSALEKRLIERLRRFTKQAVTLLSQFKSASTEVKSSDMPMLESLPLQVRLIALLMTDWVLTLWMHRYRQQSLLLADRIVRCEIVDEWISPLDGTSWTSSIGGSSMVKTGVSTATLALKGYFERLVNSINYQSSPRGNSHRRQLSKMPERAIVLLSSLRLQDMEFRDALALHGDGFSTSPSRRSITKWSIPWELQLKYRLDDTMTVGQECHVQLNTLDVPYGFNYTDPSHATVVTLSSLRYLFSLSLCIRNAQAAMLVGGSGAGKATLANQVSSIFGRQAFCAVVTPSTKYSHIARLLSGALHSGGTFCVQFPHFTNDAVQILKVLAAQLANIEQAVLTGSPVTGIHRAPIAFTAGTAMLVTCTVTSAAAPRSVDEIRSWSESMAQFDIVAADYELILEALLSVEGFADSGGLSKMLIVVHYQTLSIRSMCSRPDDNRREGEGIVFSMRVLKSIIHDVAQRMRQSEEEFERANLQRYLLRDAMISFVRAVVQDEETEGALTAIISAVFPNKEHQHEWFVKQFDREEAERRAEQTATLTRWLHTACEQDHFTPRPQLIKDALTLSSHMSNSVGTILAGACGTGKTTTYRVLAKAIDLGYKSHQERLQQHHEGDQEGDSRTMVTSAPPNRGATSSRSMTTRRIAIDGDVSVLLRVVLPGALTLTQLYGSAFTDSRKDAASSVFGRLVREAQDLFASAAHAHRRAHSTGLPDSNAPQKQVWVIFDGTIETYWIESLVLLLMKQRASTGKSASKLLLPFENGEFMTVPPNLRFLFESLNLAAASPAVVTSSAILHFRKDESGGSIDTSKPIHMVFLHRYFGVQREKLRTASTKLGAEMSRVFDAIESRLLDGDILDRLQTVIEEYAPVVPMTCLQRVQGFVALLQSVLHSIVNMSSDDEIGAFVSTSIGEDGHSQDVLSLRISLGLMYSLLWGFAACINDNSQLMLLVSSTIKSAVPEASATWSSLGREIHLFETIADFVGSRFIQIDEALVGTAAVKSRSVASHGSIGANAGPQTTTLASLAANQPPFLFVPTRSSLLSHFTMKEALRTGRLVLLIGDDNSRRTSLLRCFMQQMANINALVAESNSSETSLGVLSTGSSGESSEQSTTSEEKTLESVNRIRFHQISLVMILAARFRRENEQSALSKGLESSQSTASLPTSQYDPATRDVATLIEPAWTPRMTDAVRKLDNNSIIPFFFGMTQHDHGALELAGCMERMLQRERAGVFEPPPGKAAILLIDDLHLQSEPTADLCENYPSCFDFLRSASEHGLVSMKPAGSAVTVENLFTIASTSLQELAKSDDANAHGDFCTFRRRDAFAKLTHRCFPVLSPSCSSSELCSIFSAYLTSRMDRSPANVSTSLTASVKQELPSIVAATVVLWERLRGTILQPGRHTHQLPTLAMFNLHDLARVFQAIGSVEAHLLEDGETLLRLWAHECARTFQDKFYSGEAETEHNRFRSEIDLVREVLQQAKQFASRSQAGESSTTSGYTQEAQTTRIRSPHSGLLRAAALHHMMEAELASLALPAHGQKSHRKKSQTLVSHEAESSRPVSSTGSTALWAFIPEVVFFERRPRDIQGGRDGSSKPPVRRSSRMLLRRASCEGESFVQPKCPGTGWVYTELLDEATSTHDDANSTVQKYFGWIATSSSGFCRPDQSSARWSVLPSDPSTSSMPLSLVRSFPVCDVSRTAVN
jgi:hypothetical protein